jgi:hypothetical protein
MGVGSAVPSKRSRLYSLWYGRNMAEDTDHVVAAARASGMKIGPLLYSHGYFEAWAVGDSALLKIPRKATEYQEFSEGEGPLVACDNKLDYMESAGAFLDAVIARQRTTATPVLARFVDRIEIADVGCALYERPAGDNFKHFTHHLLPHLPAIARALLELHASFGFHGDLHFNHIFVNGVDQVTFTDPLPHPSGLVVGTVGYSLPLPPIDPTDPRDEGMLLRDVGALVKIAAGSCGWWLRWERHLTRLATAIFKGGFGNGFWTTDELAASRDQISGIPDPALRGWLDNAVEVVLNSYTVGYPPRGTTTRYLEALANPPLSDAFTKFRDAVAPLVQRLHESPSLMAFMVAERTRTGANDAVVQAFTACDPALARIRPLLDELRALVVACFGEPPDKPPPIITIPDDLYTESHELRALLTDLEVLFEPTWYTPITLGDVGGRLARAASMIEKLSANNRVQIAARRYINYVEQIK